jgi:isopenicillin-N epimerase
MHGLGAAIRHEWDLDPGWLTVNHGSYGATPRVVLAAQREWQRRMEAQPCRFMGRELPPALRSAADALAAFIGAEGSDLAFVENATVGCNAVLRSAELAPGDEILALNHGYGAVVKTARYVANRTGAVVREVPLPFPCPTDDAVVASVAATLSPRTRIAVLDHITSSSALVLPIARMVAVCQAAGVPVLVDGAHAPGQVELDLTRLGADWYVGNCHKWLMAPKGCGFLWARHDRQDGLHPVTISHGYGEGFLAEFNWTGTRDMSAYLAVTAALAFHQRLGGPALQARNAALAAEGAALLARRLGTEVGNETPGRTTPVAAMGLIRLPGAGQVTSEQILLLRERLMDAGTDAPVNVLDGIAWLRISAQAYNELEDFERLAPVVSKALSATDM